jgi:hypothetical protein
MNFDLEHIKAVSVQMLTLPTGMFFVIARRVAPRHRLAMTNINI